VDARTGAAAGTGTDRQSAAPTPTARRHRSAIASHHPPLTARRHPPPIVGRPSTGARRIAAAAIDRATDGAIRGIPAIVAATGGRRAPPPVMT